MQKLEFLKTILGEGLYERFIESVGQKEGAAALIGMVTKETDAPAEEPPATPDPEKDTPETPGVDIKALTDALTDKLQPVLAELTTLKNTVVELKAAQDTATAAVAGVENRLKVVETGVKEANAGVVELKGEKTRAQNRRASESDGNVSTKEHESPAPDSDNSFAAFLFGGQK